MIRSRSERWQLQRNDGLIDTGSGDDSLVVDNLGVKENMTLLFGDGTMIKHYSLEKLTATEAQSCLVMAMILFPFCRRPMTPPRGSAAISTFRAEVVMIHHRVGLQVFHPVSEPVSMAEPTPTPLLKVTLHCKDLQYSQLSKAQRSLILTAQLDAFFASLSADGIDVTRFGGTSTVDTAPTLTLTATPLIQDVEDSPQSIDDALTLTGEDDEVVTSASDRN